MAHFPSRFRFSLITAAVGFAFGGALGCTSSSDDDGTGGSGPGSGGVLGTGAVGNADTGGFGNGVGSGGTVGGVNDGTGGGLTNAGGAVAAGASTGAGGAMGGGATTGVGGEMGAGASSGTGGSVGAGAASGAGGTMGAGASTGTGATSSVGGSPSGTTGGAGGGSDPAGFINEDGRVAATGNPFGIQGNWYAYGDGVTSDQEGNPYREGMYCITGSAPGDGDHAAHWGAGLGLDLNYVGDEKLPYEFEGKITGFRMTLVGEVPAPPRVNFVNNMENDVVPFVVATIGESVVYSIAEAQVPLDWGVDNAGERVDNGVLYALQVLVPGAEAAGPIDLCISEFEPIYDPNGGPVVDDGPFINSDGYMLGENNDFGIEGPVYAIGDGNSTDQSGNPYTEGKYCVSGEFSGAEDDWGAGIAFDLNKAVGGGAREAFALGDLAGFQIGLSGTTPGAARIQFVINEPQEGNQPFLVARLNTTTNYRVDWAQVPTSWEVSDAGLEVDSSLYTVQLYLAGDEPGPFDVCVEEFVPLTSAELPVEAQPAASGYNGARTIDEAMLSAEYETWKSRHFLDCNDGTACVPRDEGDCISEGVAYGMLLAVGYDDRAAFDKLWAYFERHKNGNGVMKWQTNACGSATSEGSATDGELDAAMALIQASCRWGGTYESEARELITAIKNSEVTSCANGPVLKPGDNFGGCSETNPSYVAPGYYKVFQALTGDSTWGSLADSGYTLLATLQSRMSGLVPDWSDADGNPQTGDRGQYGPDASRTPWRVATDYVWNGDERAITFLGNVSSYVDANGGIARSFTPNSNYRGGLALSGLPLSSTKAQEYTDAWLTTSVDDDSYFPGTLRPIYLLLAAHLFPGGC